MPATRKKIIRIIFWAFVAVTTLPLILIFFKPPLADVPSTPEAAKSYDEKMLQLNGGPNGAREIRFTEAELNSKVQESLGDMGATSGAVALKGLTLHLTGNQLEGVFRVDTVGVTLYLVIGGTMSLANHRLVLNPTDTALGRLHVPLWLLGPAIRDRLNGPDMQSLFAVPDNVRSVRVENGELIFETE
jgi:hypothetical protein